MEFSFISKKTGTTYEWLGNRKRHTLQWFHLTQYSCEDPQEHASESRPLGVQDVLHSMGEQLELLEHTLRYLETLLSADTVLQENLELRESSMDSSDNEIHQHPLVCAQRPLLGYDAAQPSTFLCLCVCSKSCKRGGSINVRWKRLQITLKLIALQVGSLGRVGATRLSEIWKKVEEAQKRHTGGTLSRSEAR